MRREAAGARGDRLPPMPGVADAAATMLGALAHELRVLLDRLGLPLDADGARLAEGVVARDGTLRIRARLPPGADVGATRVRVADGHLEVTVPRRRPRRTAAARRPVSPRAERSGSAASRAP